MAHGRRPTSIARQMRRKAAAWLAGNVSLNAFSRWVAAKAWMVPLEVDEFPAEVELRLAEFTSGHLEKHELREIVTGALHRFELTLPAHGAPHGPRIVHGSSSPVVRLPGISEARTAHSTARR